VLLYILSARARGGFVDLEDKPFSEAETLGKSMRLPYPQKEKASEDIYLLARAEKQSAAR